MFLIKELKLLFKVAAAIQTRAQTILLQDYFADSSRVVHRDPVQNYRLLYGRENQTHTVLAFSRDLQTCDPNDREITVGKNHLIAPPPHRPHTSRLMENVNLVVDEILWVLPTSYQISLIIISFSLPQNCMLNKLKVAY